MRIEVKDGDSSVTINGDTVLIYGPNKGTEPIAMAKEVGDEWLVSTAKDEKFRKFMSMMDRETSKIQKFELNTDNASDTDINIDEVLNELQ